MKQRRLYIIAVLFTAFLISCGTSRKGSIAVITTKGTQTQSGSTASTGTSGSGVLTTNTNTDLNSNTTWTSTTTTSTTGTTNTVLQTVVYNWVNTSTVTTTNNTNTTTTTNLVIPFVNAHAETGSLHRMIDHYYLMPSDVSAIGRLVLRRLPGAIVPATCADGLTVLDFSGPFYADRYLVYHDDTLSETGQTFSYRVCLYDTQGKLGREAGVAAIIARDAKSPDPLIQFDQGTTSVDATIALTIKYPTTVADYKRMDIRRLAGASAPDVNCTDGTTVTSLTSFADFTFVDTAVASEAGSVFSYRACIYDATGNLTSVNVALGLKKYIAARWYSALNQNCPNYCSSIGKTNVASPEGAYCVSGEVYVKSAQDAGIGLSYGCWGTGCYALTSVNNATSTNGYCYMNGQVKDNDGTDRTLACYCK